MKQKTDSPVVTSFRWPPSLRAKIEAEARRLDRSLSWVIQAAIKNGLKDVGKLPSAGKDSE